MTSCLMRLLAQLPMVNIAANTMTETAKRTCSKSPHFFQRNQRRFSNPANPLMGHVIRDDICSASCMSQNVYEFEPSPTMMSKSLRECKFPIRRVNRPRQPAFDQEFAGRLGNDLSEKPENSATSFTHTGHWLNPCAGHRLRRITSRSKATSVGLHDSQPGMPHQNAFLESSKSRLCD